MSSRARTGGRIETQLSTLETAYGPFSVNQTTLALPADRYARLRARADGPADDSAGSAEAYVEIRNEDREILHVETSEGMALPGTRVALGDAPDQRLRGLVREEAGIDCAIEGIDRATIAGIRNADDRDAETLYRLIVVFSGVHSSGQPDQRVEWRESARAVSPFG